jgi:hypothetical protein
VACEALLFIVDGGPSEVFRGRWAAAQLDTGLFWGPEWAQRWIRTHEPVDGSTGITDSRLEGAAALDVTARSLVLYGGQVGHDVFARRLHLRLARRCWPGWTVEWADDGFPAVAARAGFAPVAVLDEFIPEPVEPGPGWPLPVVGGAPQGDPTLVVTIADGSGVTALASDLHLMADLAVAGPAAVLAAGPGQRLHLPHPPGSGLHVDVRDRALSWWSHAVDVDGDLGPEFARHWPGWRRRDLGDRFEEHVDLAGGALVIDRPGEREVLARVVARLSPRPGAPDGDGLPPAAERRRLLAAAVAALDAAP